MADKEFLKEIMERKLRSMFPDDDERQLVSDALHEYGGEAYHKEPERVRLNILKLAGVDMGEVRKYVKVAKQDYRDVIAWAEYPEQINAKTYQMPKEQADEIRKRDRAQYERWLSGEE